MLLSDTTPRARKPHVCDMCNARIEVGRIYRRVVLVEGRDLLAYKSHPICHRIINLSDEEWDAGWFWDEVHRLFCENPEEDPVAALAKFVREEEEVEEVERAVAMLTAYVESL